MKTLSETIACKMLGHTLDGRVDKGSACWEAGVAEICITCYHASWRDGGLPTRYLDVLERCRLAATRMRESA